MFTADGTRILLSPPQAPRANAVRERMTGTLRRELFDRLLIVNEQQPRSRARADASPLLTSVRTTTGYYAHEQIR